jgi:probable rRNA maturation factor
VSAGSGQIRRRTANLSPAKGHRAREAPRSIDTKETGSASPHIEIVNRQRAKKIDLASLRSFATEALDIVSRLAENRSFPEEILVVLVSDSRIADIHRDFMNVAGATDVITFQHGEIFISVETAERQAKEVKTTFEFELRLYLLHGLLHLAGYDDMTQSGYRTIARKQDKLMKQLLGL